LVALCERLKDQVCHCGESSTSGSSSRPIEVEDDSGSYQAPKISSPTIRAMKPPGAEEEMEEQPLRVEGLFRFVRMF